MGAFMYIGLLVTTVLFIGSPLVLFQLMLETCNERAGRRGLRAERAAGHERSAPPPPSVRTLTCA